MPSPDTPATNPYAAPAFHPEVSAGAVSGHYAFAKDPRRLTKILLGLLVFYLIKTLFLFLWSIFAFLSRGHSFSDAQLDAIHLLNRVIVTVNMVGSIATVIVFGMWIYRAGVNSRGFGAQGMKDSPGWGVGWYFIPIANLFRPYQAMKQIWQVSGDPTDWENQKGSPILVWWWTFWTILIVLAAIVPQLDAYWRMQREFLPTIIDGILKTMLTSALTISAIVLVRTLTRRQEALVARSAA